MSRALITLLQELELDTQLPDDKGRWLNNDLKELTKNQIQLFNRIIVEGRKALYAAPGCAHIQNVDTLYMLGFCTLQYHIKQLVVQTRKGKIHVPSPFGGSLIQREPKWRKIIPVLTVY